MKKPLSLTIQAIYVLITALQLIFVPNMLLGMFGFEPTSEVWIKVLGVVLIAFVIVYFGVIQYGNKELFKITMIARNY